MKISILLIALFFSPFLLFSQDPMVQHYKIYNTAKHQTVGIDDIVNDMANADVLFFGEEHSDSTAHYLEFALFKKLSEKYPSKVALSMEMFETDCQNILDEYLKGLIREKNFINDARAWNNYKDYRPMVELAKTNKSPVIAANAPARYTNMVNRMGLSSLLQLNKTGQSYLPPLPIDTATGAYYDKFSQIMGGHAAMGGMQLYQAQNLWDATMGWSVAKALNNNPGSKIFQVNGSFHSEDKLGAATQLKKYAPKARIVNIATYSDENFDKPDWEKLSKGGDYIIVTDPALPKTF